MGGDKLMKKVSPIIECSMDKLYTIKESCLRFADIPAATLWGRDGCLVVIMFAFHFDDPSSNLAEAYNFFCKMMFEKNESKQK